VTPNVTSERFQEVCSKIYPNGPAPKRLHIQIYCHKAIRYSMQHWNSIAINVRPTIQIAQSLHSSMNMVASGSSSCCGCRGVGLRSDDDNDEQIIDNDDVIDTGADRKHQNSVADLPNLIYVVTKVPSVCNQAVSSPSNEIYADVDLSKKRRRRGRRSLSSYYHRIKKETQHCYEQHNQKIGQVESAAPSSPSSVANILAYTNTDSMPQLSDEGYQSSEETASKQIHASKETRFTKVRNSRATAA